MKRTHISVLVLLTAVLFIAPFHSWGANKDTELPFSIGIDRPSIFIASDSKSTSNGEIYVENTGTSPVKIRVYTEDWSYAQDGSKKFYKAGTRQDSCAGWIHVSPASFLLNAGRSEKVSYVMTTPKDAVGGHVAVIFFESIFEQKEGISVGGRIGSIVYQETSGKTLRSGEIAGITAVADKGKAVDIKLTFRNTGNAHINAEPVVTILAKDGQKMGEFSMPRVKCLPGDAATVEKGYVVLAKGDASEYSATVRITLENKVIERTVNFSVKK